MTCTIETLQKIVLKFEKDIEIIKVIEMIRGGEIVVL